MDSIFRPPVRGTPQVRPSCVVHSCSVSTTPRCCNTPFKWGISQTPLQSLRSTRRIPPQSRQIFWGSLHIPRFGNPFFLLREVIDTCRERRLTRDHGHITLAPALLERFCAKDPVRAVREHCIWRRFFGKSSMKSPL